MRITCPSCKAAYNVPDELIGAAPRQLRCARCATEFTVAPPAPEAPAWSGPIGLPPAPEPPVRFDPPPEPTPAPPPLAAPPQLDPETDPFRGYRGSPAPRGRAMLVLAWLLTLLILAAAAAASYVWRGQIMAAWPPSQRVYLALGLR